MSTYVALIITKLGIEPAWITIAFPMTESAPLAVKINSEPNKKKVLTSFSPCGLQSWCLQCPHHRRQYCQDRRCGAPLVVVMNNVVVLVVLVVVVVVMIMVMVLVLVKKRMSMIQSHVHARASECCSLWTLWTVGAPISNNNPLFPS